jgi:hypothetical protein
VAGSNSVAQWIAGKLDTNEQITAVEPIGSGFLRISRKQFAPFVAAAIGVKEVVELNNVSPLFGVSGVRPVFVVNVPSKAIWSGDAIEFIHDAPAAFGTFGELQSASREECVSDYRNKNYGFFERVFRQHGAVSGVTRLSDRVYQLHRHSGMPDVTVVLVDSYDMSAEDVRNVRDLYGRFDAAVKMTSYGSVTTAAKEAADSMGANAFKLRELMGRLNRP